METIYLVTGAAGHLGGVITKQLIAQNKKVRVLIMPHETLDVKGVSIFYGDVRDVETLRPCFEDLGDTQLIVIHCAGIISIASKVSPLLYDVNVNGTQNMVDLCQAYGVKRLVYVSSVHAIAEKPHGEVIVETDEFDPDKIVGAYAKTKAMATANVLAAAKQLDVVVVHPSGIVGPYDHGNNHLSALIIDYYKRRLLFGIVGGYDFVDVRDVAQGVISASENGRAGHCYILSNQYYSIKSILDYLAEITKRPKLKIMVPMWLIKPMVPLAEWYYRIRKEPPLFTDYSIYTLQTNARFSHEKASLELGYTTRAMDETLNDSLNWLKRINKI